jgi:hypothetical protein
VALPTFSRCRIEYSDPSGPIDFTELDAENVMSQFPFVPFWSEDGLKGRAVVLDVGGDEEVFWVELDISDVASATKEEA